MITSLLIANRGEIARRIMRSCARLGIRTIAVYSDADRDAPHVAAADEAIRIGPAPARESYLRLEAILDAARRSGAEAIHPGYGFLSEKPELAAACEACGLIFIGPSADRIAAMGPKIGAKRIAAAAGVPGVPGYSGEDQSYARLAAEAAAIGFPVMVKASAGGGGRGMRAVSAPGDLAAAVDLARGEAAAAFGDPSLLLEKLVRHPRHLEVQVAGDRHGHVVHLFERDCSVQRNHQKVLEEAPAPNLPPAIRRKLLERGVAIARAIAYDNLGTVEFILEAGQDEPWFLEMNTRLQVEHPVTEAITGFDLVEWQLRIACGEPLPARQDEITASGHAIEARITAERAEHGFRPDAGRITLFRPPASLRVDSGVADGSEVTLFYDSLLAKAIAFGETREAARVRLAAGLRDFAILGPATTLNFLVDAVEQKLFAAGQATTRFIDEAFPGGWTPPRVHIELARASAALLYLAGLPTPGSAWGSLVGFRVIGLAETHLVVADEAGPMALRIAALPDGARRVHSPSGELVVSLRATAADFTVETSGRVLRGAYARGEAALRLTLAGEAYEFSVTPAVRVRAEGAAAGSGAVLAPMPGVIAEVKVAVGETVEAGQVVVVLESMKLFSSLQAAVAGVVTDVGCIPGETVSAGKRLVFIEAEASSGRAQPS